MSEDKKDFNELVDLAMTDPALSAMRPVVEKELLHYEIFQALDAEGLLKDLVFQGVGALHFSGRQRHKSQHWLRGRSRRRLGESARSPNRVSAI